MGKKSIRHAARRNSEAATKTGMGVFRFPYVATVAFKCQTKTGYH